MPNMTIDARFAKVRSDLEKYVNTHPEIDQYLFSGDYGVIFDNPPSDGSSPIPHQLYLYPTHDQKKINFYMFGYPMNGKTKTGELKIGKTLENLSQTIHQGGFFNGKSHNERALLRNTLLTGVDLSSYQAKNAETIHTLNYHINELQKLEPQPNTAPTDEALQKVAKEAKGVIAYIDQEIARTKKNEGRLTSKLGNILQAARQAIFEHYKSSPHFLMTYIQEVTRDFSPEATAVSRHEATTSATTDPKTNAIALISSKLQAWQTERNKDQAYLKYNELVILINNTLVTAKKSMTLLEKMSSTPPSFVAALSNIKESVEGCHATLQSLAVTEALDKKTTAADAFSSRPGSGNTDPVMSVRN